MLGAVAVSVSLELEVMDAIGPRIVKWPVLMLMIRTIPLCVTCSTIQS